MIHIEKSQEWVNINIGGQIFTTRKETLHSSVYFRALFSGEYNDDLSTLVIDRDPKIFRHVLNLLRDASYNYPLKYLSELDFYGIDYETDDEISPLQPQEENKLEIDITHSNLYKCPTDPIMQLLCHGRISDYVDPQAKGFTKESMVIMVDKNISFLRRLDYITRILIVAKADKRTLNKIEMNFGMGRISFDPPVCQLLSRIGKPKDLQSFEKYLEDKKYHVYEIPVDIKTVSIFYTPMTIKTEYDVEPLEEHIYVYGGFMQTEDIYTILMQDIIDVGIIFSSHYYPINTSSLLTKKCKILCGIYFMKDPGDVNILLDGQIITSINSSLILRDMYARSIFTDGYYLITFNGMCKLKGPESYFTVKTSNPTDFYVIYCVNLATNRGVLFIDE